MIVDTGSPPLALHPYLKAATEVGTTDLTWPMLNPRRYGGQPGAGIDAALATAKGNQLTFGGAILFSPGVYTIGANQTINGATSYEPGAIVKIAAGVTLTLNGPIVAGPWQIFDLSLGGVVAIPRTGAVYPEWWGALGDGVTDDSTAFNRCIAAATTGQIGRRILLQASPYALANALDAHNTYGLIIEGPCSPVGATAGAFSILFFSQAGAGDCVNAKSTIGFTLRNVCLQATNVAFTGIVVNAEGTGGHGDTSYFLLDACEIKGPIAGSAVTYGLALTQSIASKARDSLFAYLDVGIVGDRPAAAYANSVTIEDCTFLGMRTAAIKNAGNRWTWRGGTAENATDGGAAGYAETAGYTNLGPFVIEDVWFGDASTNTRPWVVYQGYAFSMRGCFLQDVTGSQPNVRIGSSTGGPVSGFHFSGCTWYNVAPMIEVLSSGGVVTNFAAFGNNAVFSETLVKDTGGKLLRPVILGGGALGGLSAPGGPHYGIGMATYVTGVAVGTVAATIYTDAAPNGVTAIVTGANGTKVFVDMVSYSPGGAVHTISSFDAANAPALRTYTTSGRNLQLAMGAAGYTATVTAFEQ